MDKLWITFFIFLSSTLVNAKKRDFCVDKCKLSTLIHKVVNKGEKIGREKGIFFHDFPQSKLFFSLGGRRKKANRLLKFHKNAENAALFAQRGGLFGQSQKKLSTNARRKKRRGLRKKTSAKGLYFFCGDGIIIKKKQAALRQKGEHIWLRSRRIRLSLIASNTIPIRPASS